MTPLLGFSPDVEPTTPGAILECQNVMPFASGMKAAPSAADAGLNALAAACQGAAVTRNLSGASRLFAGTSSKIYEAYGATWNDVSGGAYTLGVDDVWRFVVFGNSSLACNPSTYIQRSTGGAFSTISGAPKAKAIVAAKGFVVAFSTNEATYGDSPDRWWCCALNDETSWAPSVSTQATTGRLVEGSGGLTAALRMGDNIVAYKDRCIFVGQYVGGAVVWQWTPPIGDVGCVGVEAVADTPWGHVFVGSDNIYLFDGTRPDPVGNEIHQWWIDNSSAQYRYKTKLMWDRDNGLVWMFYTSSTSSGACDRCIVLHVQTKRWGVADMTVEAVLNYTSPAFTYDSGTPLITTYDSGPSIAFDSPFWLAYKSNPAMFSSSHKVMSLTGTPGTWYFMTGDVGDESASSMCRAVRVRWSKKPLLSTCDGYTKSTSGDIYYPASSSSFDGSKFPMRQTDRFHRFKVSGSGAMQVSALDVELIEAGRR